MSDANKTELTKQLTAAAVLWLEERGFRPVESEVPVCGGWVADLASFCYPSRTEAQRLKLLDRRPQYNKGGDFEIHCHKMNAWKKRFERIPSPLTAIVEVKTSAADFKKDVLRKFKWPTRSNLSFVAVPASMNTPALGDSIGEHWGILVLDAAGRVRAKRIPNLRIQGLEETLRLVAAIALRRDAFTRYERSREFQRQWREHSNHRTANYRMASVVNCVLSIAKCEHSIDDAVAVYLGSSVKLSQRQREELEKLSAVGCQPSPTAEAPR